MERKKIARKEAKENGLKRYYTGKPCKHGHVAERQTSNNCCVVCQRSRLRAWEAANPEKERAFVRAWKAANPSALTALNAKRKANKLRATPPWLTQEQIRAMAGLYRFARIRKRLLGGDWHVDHIVPLQGETVCGLHVPWNLQVIRAEANMQKKNKLLEAA